MVEMIGARYECLYLNVCCYDRIGLKKLSNFKIWFLFINVVLHVKYL